MPPFSQSVRDSSSLQNKPMLWFVKFQRASWLIGLQVVPAKLWDVSLTCCRMNSCKERNANQWLKQVTEERVLLLGQEFIRCSVLLKRSETLPNLDIYTICIFFLSYKKEFFHLSSIKCKYILAYLRCLALLSCFKSGSETSDQPLRHGFIFTAFLFNCALDATRIYL